MDEEPRRIGSYLSTLGELREWLHSNGFKVLRESIGPKSIQLLLASNTGKVLEMTFQPGTRPSKWAPSLADVFADEITPDFHSSV